MKMKVTVEYEIELSESEYDDFVGAVLDEYREEELDPEVDVEGGIRVAVADWLVRESQVGNYNQYCREVSVKVETTGEF